MILSVSRRTDIPCYYTDWFLNRINAGFVYVRNPRNQHQISKIAITPEVVDCIVFWTKNPEEMLPRLSELGDYKYYFQFTLNSYGFDIEPNLPHKKHMIPIFQSLSNKIGKEKVIWRYDPILFTDRYTMEYHLRAFAQLASQLNGYTNQVIISFLDMYAKTKRNMKNINCIPFENLNILEFAANLAQIAAANGMTIKSCAEKMDLSPSGIEHGSCIDKDLIEQITGCRIHAKKDNNQRDICGCMESIEVGAYDTCKNGCKYCYANYSDDSIKANLGLYDKTSPLLCGVVGSQDRVSERKTKSILEPQINFIYDK